MNATLETPVGSTDVDSVPKIKPLNVRRLAGYEWWFVPRKDLKGVTAHFRAGLMRDVTFNAKATVMPGITCGGDRVSEAEITGVLEIAADETPTMPHGAISACALGYDNGRKCFHDKAQPDVIITRADYLVLLPDGQSIVGWKEEA